VMGLVCWKTSS